MQGDVEREPRIVGLRPVDVGIARQRFDGGVHRGGAGVVGAALLADREDGEQPVAHEFQHVTAARHDRLGHGVEMVVQDADQLFGRRRIGKPREAAEIGEEQRGIDGLAEAAPDLAAQHAAAGRQADIGVEHLGGDVEQRDAVGGQAERRHHALDRRDVGVAEAAGPLGREGHGNALQAGRVGIPEGHEASEVVGAAGGAELLQDGEALRAAGAIERPAAPFEAVAQHETEGALLEHLGAALVADRVHGRAGLPPPGAADDAEHRMHRRHRHVGAAQRHPGGGQAFRQPFQQDGEAGALQALLDDPLGDFCRVVGHVEKSILENRLG